MAKLKIRPLGDRIVVEPLEAEEKTKGGIILPDTAKEKPQKGKVVAVGKGRVDENGKAIPMEIKVGDKVLYGKYAGRCSCYCRGKIKEVENGKANTTW